MPPATLSSTTTLQAGHVIDVGGLRTHLHEAGTGQTVLLLHGSGPGVSAWANWRLVLPALVEQGFHVVAPDQLGFGATARPAEGDTAGPPGRRTRSASWRHWTSTTSSWWATRWGGSIALSLAHARPDLVGRIVLMGTTGVPFALPDGLDEVWGYTPDRDRMRSLIELFAFDQSIVTDDLVQLRYQRSAAPAARASYEAMFPAPRQRWLDDLALDEPALRAIEQPTLLVHGHDDRVIPFASSLQALDLLPNAELHAFSNCGHWVQIEQTDRFVEVVVSFLHAGLS